MSCSILCLFISFAEKIPKMKISKILVPVDFSDISINALRYAAAFACASGAGITILHIADPDSIMNDIKGNLSPEHMIELLKAENYMKGIKTESVIKKGKVADLILAEAEKSEAGLIVMGTQGAGTLSRNLVGTNTTKVVGKSKCPVLAIPEEASYTTVRRVVLAVDLHHRADQVISDVVATMKVIGAAVLLVYVDHKEILQHQHELDKLVSEIKAKTGYERIAGKVIKSDQFLVSIENFALDIEADILIMITHHRSILESLFDPSETKSFAYHTSIPLMAVPEVKTPVFFF